MSKLTFQTRNFSIKPLNSTRLFTLCFSSIQSSTTSVFIANQQVEGMEAIYLRNKSLSHKYCPFIILSVQNWTLLLWLLLFVWLVSLMLCHQSLRKSIGVTIDWVINQKASSQKETFVTIKIMGRIKLPSKLKLSPLAGCNEKISSSHLQSYVDTQVKKYHWWDLPLSQRQ